MNITVGCYLFHSGKVIIKIPFEITKETEKCYFTNGGRYLKEDIGKPYIKSVTTYPYIELVMVDADEETLRKRLSEWFDNISCRIKEKPTIC